MMGDLDLRGRDDPRWQPWHPNALVVGWYDGPSRVICNDCNPSTPTPHIPIRWGSLMIDHPARECDECGVGLIAAAMKDLSDA